MTDFLWALLAVAAVGWAFVALLRDTRALYLTTLVLLIGLTILRDLPNDPHPYFGVLALTIHTAFYFVVGLVVLWFARKVWPATRDSKSGGTFDA
jgi:hypothetical protein